MSHDHYHSRGCIKCGAELPEPERAWADFGPAACPSCGVMHEYSWDCVTTDEEDIPLLMVELAGEDNMSPELTAALLDYQRRLLGGTP